MSQYTENNIRGIVEDIQAYDKKIKIIFLSIPPTKIESQFCSPRFKCNHKTLQRV